MADWTILGTAFISASSAIGGAALGYLTARRQAEAETERMRLGHGEEHLRHRQGVYHNFLDSAHRFHQAAGEIDPFGTVDEYRGWARIHEHHSRAVSLFGTEAAWRAADELNAVIEEAMGVAPKYEGDVEDRFLAAYDAVIRAMRPDTAPNGLFLCAARATGELAAVQGRSLRISLTCAGRADLGR